MQQTLEQNWYRQSRLKGAFRFHQMRLGKLTLLVLLILLAGQVLSFLLAAVGVSKLSSPGISLNFATEMILLLVLSCIAAHSSTTFLLRFGTSRFAVWLSNLIALTAAGLVFLLGSLVLDILSNYLTLTLSQVSSSFSIASYSGSLTGSQIVSRTLGESLRQLPLCALWTLEWACMLYLLGCCLRRNKAVTLTVCIVGPLVVWILLLLPAVRQVIDVVESGAQGEIVLTGMQWYQWLMQAALFVKKYWQWLQAGVALLSLPLSYLCMRSTRQP